MFLFLLIFLKTLRNRLRLMQKFVKEIKCHIHKRDYFKSLGGVNLDLFLEAMENLSSKFIDFMKNVNNSYKTF